jgi:tRNA (cmo5U34)-methyltransferase
MEDNNQINEDKKKRFEGKLSSEYVLSIQCTPGYLELEEDVGKRIFEVYSTDSATKNNILQVLDIGIGTGITTKEILKYNPNAKITGVDSEPKMIEQAKINLENQILAGNVDLVQSDARDYLSKLISDRLDSVLPMPKSTHIRYKGQVDNYCKNQIPVFNVIASAYTLHNCSLSYRYDVLRKSFSLLKPGGMLINGDKYAVDDQERYLSVLAGQLSRYALLAAQGRPDLQVEWIKHELEDQDPSRIMRESKATWQLENIGFKDVVIWGRREQYAILTAFKPNKQFLF